MQPLTSKELDYIADSLNNEDLLVKRYMDVASRTQTPAIQTLCQQMAGQHMQHYTELQSLLQQHSNLAPTRPQ